MAKKARCSVLCNASGVTTPPPSCTIQACINAYKRWLSTPGIVSFYDDLKEAQAECKNNPTFFLRRCVCNRKRHQQRLRNKAVNQAVKRLRAKGLTKFKNFEGLYDYLFDLLTKPGPNGEPAGISYSTVYDTALRLAYSLGLPMPKDYVYVHRHLKRTAKKILVISTLL